VFGLSFATTLTLVVTPAMLALPDRLRRMFRRSPKTVVQAEPSLGV